MKSTLAPLQRYSLVLSCLLLIFLAGFAGTQNARAEVTLPHVFGSHMVLQRDRPIMIWGWATPHETVTVQLGTVTETAKANAKGEWKLSLPSMPAGGPYTLTVSGSSTVTYDDVMIGEVWLCSGQSNMEFGLGKADHAKEEIANANHPGLRLLLVQHNWTALPQNDIDGSWKVCTPQTVTEGGWEGFSAVAYFFGRELNQQLGVTVGLIESDWGGTRIESWTPPEGFAEVPSLKEEYNKVLTGDPASRLHRKRLQAVLGQYDQWLHAARAAEQANALVPPVPQYPDDLLPPHDLQQATALYNGMIHPLIPYTLRGAIWYQGEANEAEGLKYAERMRALIRGWRTLWDEGNFPFYFVQIAPYNYGTPPEKLAEFWEAQTRASQVNPDTGMAVVNDIGNFNDIHPTDKQDVGHRLALLALANTYGRHNLVSSGPTFKSMGIRGNTLRLEFNNVGSGLASRDGKPLNCFEIIDADSDDGFVPADARIDGDTVVLTAPGVEHPVAMRFDWGVMAVPNLMNREGLPAGSFHAGVEPRRDWLRAHVPEAMDYRLVYDLDLTKMSDPIIYSADYHERIKTAFDRIAYFVELRDANDRSQDIYVSMDAFTNDASKIGVPFYGSGEFYQENVTNLDVFSNVKGIVTGDDLSGGNLEFWPNNYTQQNSAHVPNASDDVFDFGDEPTDPADGYGSMQVHNHDARQTLFAINHWSQGAQGDVGIGNQPTNNPDWTFAANAGNYTSMRLMVFVREVK